MLGPAALLALLLAPDVAASPQPAGLVVEGVEKGTPAAAAGLRRGDVLLSWRPASGHLDAPAGGPLASPFDLARVEIEAAPRTAVVLAVMREGRPLELRVEGGEWRVQTCPLPTGCVNGEDRLLAMAEEAAARSDWTLACWLAVRRVERALPASEPPDSFAVAADTCASSGRSDRMALAQQTVARFQQSRQRYPEAEAAWREALRLWEDEAPAGLAVARVHHGLALLLMERGLPDDAEPHFRRALELRQALAPEGLEVAATLNQLGFVAYLRAASDCALELLTRAVDIARRLAPDSLIMAEILVNLGTLVKHSGRFDEGRDLALSALATASAVEPGGLTVAEAELELGRNAWTRGDLAVAESHYRKALAIAERVAPDGPLAERCLNNLATVAQARGDWESAEALYGRALVLCRRHWPGALFTAGVMANLGESLAEQGRLAEADALFREAVALAEKAGPRTETLTFILSNAAKLSQARGDRASFEAQVERAWRVTEKPTYTARNLDVGYWLKGNVALGRGELAEAGAWFEKAIIAAERYHPGDDRLAVAHRSLAMLHRRQGRTLEAAEDYRRTIDVIEAQRVRLGGRGQGRLGFGVRHSHAYQEAVEVMLEAGRPEEAFQYWERSRARGFLEMLAERDPVPQLTAIAYPQPLSLQQARRTLDPDTALLAYAMGPHKTVLFVLTPGENADKAVEIATVVIPVGSEVLRPRIAAWRRLSEMIAPSPAFFAEARALYDLLIRPVERRLTPAKRLLLCPDGPLHQLPFAALRRNGTYLAEWKPLSFVPSATVLAQIVQSRPAAPARASLAAFGDPRAPRLPALDGGRREVGAIVRLFPGARAYLGPEATEERLLSARHARYIHFAGHGLVDDQRPLESALAFTPEPSGTGLLHAWEIFERVRLDADLVTLSACRSAAGKEFAGEGVVGLTRAFQFAGARSVLASLWNVSDRSTPSFMRRFYAGLKRGIPKDEALRRAQAAAIGEGHHPIRWAGFQLHGDWR